ncbi:glucose PTS transporter subunit IIA [Bdellovibrionota bacterium FG-2]
MAQNKNQIFATLQRVGQSLMVPVSVLPAAGLLVAVGRMIQKMTENKLLHAFGDICFTGGIAIFEQLPVVFAIGVAIGFTGGAAVAGLASVVGYFTLINVLKAVGDARELSMAINTGVFGGIIIGLLSATLYKKFHQIKLHPVFGFFAGKRFVPIVTAGASILVAIVLGFVWPPIQSGINSFGISVMASDYGPAFYAAVKRLLIPVGLHHVYYPPFLYQFGEFVTESGKVLHGETARYFAGDPTAGRFMASEFPMMLFGLPAAAFAMYLRADASRKKAVAGIMLSAALTSIVTGITEPIEFAFIFVAPILFVFHVLAAFASGVLTGMLDIHLGYTFSASMIDFGLGFFNSKNSLYLFTIVGPLIGLTYFSVFYTLIGWLNLKTPGREELEEQALDVVEGSERAGEILIALGGAANIRDLDACITRLRLQVGDAGMVNQARLKQLGAAGIMNAGGGSLQVVFGTQSDQIKEEIRSLIASGASVGPGASKQVLGVVLCSPLSGKLLALADVPDETFSHKILGDGFAVEPSEGIVYSPVDGEVAQMFRTNHAVGIVTADGLEILVHVGIDTVKLQGKGFRACVATGARVKKGDRLIEFDLEAVRREAKSMISPVVVTNLDKTKGLDILRKGSIKAKDDILRVRI